MGASIDFFVDLIEENGTGWFVGQIFGIVAIIFGFISYQVKTQRQVLFMQSAVAVVFGMHYCLIGAYSGMAMNAVNVVRNIFYDRRNQKGSTSMWIPMLFVVIQCVMCALTWDAWYSVFILLGIGVNTFCMSFRNPQNVRRSILVTSPLVLTYDIFARSVGGSVYETVALISAAIGIVRNGKRNE